MAELIDLLHIAISILVCVCLTVFVLVVVILLIHVLREMFKEPNDGKELGHRDSR